MKSLQERTDRIEQKLHQERAAKARRKKMTLAFGSCAAAFILVLSLVLFLPFPTQNIAKYKDSEYYSVICKLDAIHKKTRVYHNNFEILADSVKEFFGMFKGFGAAGEDAMPPATEAPDRYEEVTNNQTQGVIEGDLFKRSDSKIYYLTTVRDGYRLDVYPIAGMATQKSASLTVVPEQGMSFLGYGDERELYLNESATRALVVSPCYSYADRVLYTVMIGIDLTGGTPAETGRVYVSGNYVSSRLVENKLLLVTNFQPYRPENGNFDFGNEKTFLPHTGTADALSPVPMDAIVMADEAQTARYTVLALLDYNTLEVQDSASLMSYSDEVYVSENHIFATLSHQQVHELTEPSGNQTKIWRNETRISCFEYRNGLNPTGTVNVNGTVNDRYSMDEYEGVLRVFTSTVKHTWPAEEPWNGKYISSLPNSSLYCYSLADFSLLAAVENFAPDNETVQSARFQGDVAYACTAITISFTDPVYAFDLSDYNNITYTDTGTISGYSLFLTPFTDDTMVGIGYGDWREILKIELYRQGDNKVDSVAKVELEGVEFSNKFKSYFIDKKNGLIGIAVERYYEQRSLSYLLFRFDGYNLVQISETVLQNENAYKGEGDGYTEERAVLIDGILYLFAPSSGLHLLELSEL